MGLFQQQRPRETGFALLAMMSLSPLPRAQDPLACIPADQRPICLASPASKNAVPTSKSERVVVFTPGVANDGASRVVAANGYANVRGLPVYGNKNDTDPIVLWEKGDFLKAAQAISGRVGAGSLPAVPLLGAALLAERGAAAFHVGRVQVPLSGAIKDGINGAYGLTHGLLGAVVEESTENLSKIIVESLKAGKSLELIAHSQGGIITANALVLARNDPKFAAMTDTQWLEATKNISVVCFGSPQRVFNVANATSYLHQEDWLVSKVNKLRATPSVVKVAAHLKRVARENLPLIVTPELKPEVVVLGGKNIKEHDFKLYLEDLPQFRAKQILSRANGKGAKACDLVVELAENGAASPEQIEETALETFGSIGPDGPTQFQNEFARRFIQYQKQDRLDDKHWSQGTQELFYHSQGAAYPWEKPARLVPKGTRVSDLRRQLAHPNGEDETARSDEGRASSDPSLIYNRRNSSAAIATAAIGNARATEDESRRRNDTSSSEARSAAQTSMAGVPPQHSDAVNANREHHETVASAPSALTDERSRDFQGQLADRRAIDERSTSAANADAKEKTEKQAEGAREAAAERVASKEKAERDQKAADETRAADSQRAGETEARVAAAERTAAEAKEEADRASKKAAAAAQKKAPVTRVYNRITTIIQNFLGREELPPPPPPQEGPVILP